MNTNIDVLAEMEQAHATLKGLAYASELTGDHIQADAMLEARAAVAELIEVTSLLTAQLALHGDMDDGCFYYNGRSASELQTPMADVSAALARVKGA